MKRTRVHLKDLVTRYDADSATWEFREDTDHMTRGVMCWHIMLHNAALPTRLRARRVSEYPIKLATCCDLIVDEYVADLVWARLEQANETTQA